jgi:hypothetical protein
VIGGGSNGRSLPGKCKPLKSDHNITKEKKGVGERNESSERNNKN